MDSSTIDSCGPVDKVNTPAIGKRRLEDHATLDADSIKKRLRSYRFRTSLLDLNDDCLRSIFDHSDKVDLCHMRNVCTRFASLAESAFSVHLKLRPQWTKLKAEHSKSDMRRIFYNFGHLFRSFHACGDIDSDVLQRLTQLDSLILERVRVDSEMVSTIHAGEHLKILDMFNCTFVPSNRDNALRILSRALCKRSSSLKRLLFQQQIPPLRLFSKFLRFNKQLRCLGLPTDIPERYISQILKNAEHLNELVLFSNNSESNHIFQLIRNLKNPKLVAIDGRANVMVSAEPLLDRMRQTTPDIALLVLTDFIFDPESISIISEMKEIQHLVLRGKINCPGSVLVSLVASLPLLYNFTVSFKSCSSDYPNRGVTVNVLKEMVRAGKKLSFLKLSYVRDIRVNANDYAELDDLVRRDSRKQKLAIAIEGCKLTTRVDVPIRVQRVDLKICYTNNITCLCKQ